MAPTPPDQVQAHDFDYELNYRPNRILPICFANQEDRMLLSSLLFINYLRLLRTPRWRQISFCDVYNKNLIDVPCCNFQNTYCIHLHPFFQKKKKKISCLHFRPALFLCFFWQANQLQFLGMQSFIARMHFSPSFNIPKLGNTNAMHTAFLKKEKENHWRKHHWKIINMYRVRPVCTSI